MKIIFFGSSNFAVPSLKALLESRHEIGCVVTQPDKKSGRGLVLASTAVKKTAGDYGIEIYQPARINTIETVNLLRKTKSDLFIVVAYGQILNKDILMIPRLFSLNAHASLLPLYRGAAPINWAIIKGEAVTGVTVMKMVEAMDGGPIILSKETRISPEDTALTLGEKLSIMAADLLLSALDKIEGGEYKLIPQQEDKATYAPKLKKEDGKISWNIPAAAVRNLVRGCAGWPGTYTHYRNKLLKIFETEISPSEKGKKIFKPGQIIDVSKNGIVVATAKDNLTVKKMQIEGKRIMDAADFVAGHKISSGEFFR